MNPSHPIASLYVGGLHPDVTEAMLYEKFRPAGPISSIQVCRDTMTLRSLGYAYVDFQQPEDAERALDTMNYDVIKGTPVRILWSRRGPSLRKSAACNIFIKNLDDSIDDKALCDAFSGFGPILYSKVVGDEDGSQGFGFLHFETKEAAERAVNTMNGRLLNGRRLFVGSSKPHKQRGAEPGARAEGFTNVYIKDFGEGLNDERLKDLFGKYGPVLSAKVITHKNGKSKGFGFVEFVRHEDAQKAVDEMHGKAIDGRTIYVGRAQEKTERQSELKKYQAANLYIKNLDVEIDDNKLQKLFSPFGTITSAKVMVEGGRSRGFGFVCYASPEEATKAITGMHGRIVACKPLYVALAQRKEDRQAYLTSQYTERMAIVKAVPNPFISPYHPPPTSYSPAAIPLAQNRAAHHLAQLRPSSRWTAQGARPRPNTSTQTKRPHPKATTAEAAATSTVRSVPQYKYAARVRNPQQYRNAQSQVAMQQPAVPMQRQEPLTASMLASAPPKQQKQMLGDRLFPLIHARHPTLAAKLTGMLLEMENPEVLHLLESPESLCSKVNEAISVLRSEQGTRTFVTNAAGETMPAVPMQRQEPLTASMLASAPPKQQKQMLGDRLFPLIHARHPTLAAKLTGMLLEMENSEVLHLLESPESLCSKVNEAISVLRSEQGTRTFVTNAAGETMANATLRSFTSCAKNIKIWEVSTKYEIR